MKNLSNPTFRGFLNIFDTDSPESRTSEVDS